MTWEWAKFALKIHKITLTRGGGGKWQSGKHYQELLFMKRYHYKNEKIMYRRDFCNKYNNLYAEYVTSFYKLLGQTTQ